MSFDPSLPFQTSELVGEGAVLPSSCRTYHHQEEKMCDHYMAPPLMANPALTCMRGNTGPVLAHRHPPQDPPSRGRYQNLMVIMQIIEEVSARLGLVALLQEKPFTTSTGPGSTTTGALRRTTGSCSSIPRS